MRMNTLITTRARLLHCNLSQQP